jgi:hypothetical protein
MVHSRWKWMLALAALASACASTRVQSVWEAPTLSSQAFHRVLVVGMMREESVRKAYETRLAADLRAQGVPATESFRFIPQISGLQRENLRPLTQSEGFDAVLIGRVTDVRVRREYVPADTWSTLDAWGFYDYGWADARVVDNIPIVNVETRLYEVKEGAGQLVWSAVSESYDPGSNQEMGAHIAEGVAKRVAKDVRFAPAASESVPPDSSEQGIGGSGQ